MKVVEPAGLLPKNINDLSNLLDVFLLDKAIYELGYELNNRPNWVHIPLKGLLRLLSSNNALDEATP